MSGILTIQPACGQASAAEALQNREKRRFYGDNTVARFLLYNGVWKTSQTAPLRGPSDVVEPTAPCQRRRLWK
jgi:hypothetical protein